MSTTSIGDPGRPAAGHRAARAWRSAPSRSTPASATCPISTRASAAAMGRHPPTCARAGASI